MFPIHMPPLRKRPEDIPSLVKGVVLVCITWVLLTILVPLLWMIIQMRREMARLQRTGGVEAGVFYVDGN